MAYRVDSMVVTVVSSGDVSRRRLGESFAFRGAGGFIQVDCWDTPRPEMLEDGADNGNERVGEFHSPPKGYLEWHSHATSPHLATTTSLGKLVNVDKVHCRFALLAQGWPSRLIVRAAQ